MKTAMYLRVSTEEQKEKQTIASQRSFGERYFASHNILVYGWYADDGVSGIIPLEQRPEGARLLKDAQSGKIDTVFVYRLDRLGRDPRLILNIISELESHGVQVKSLTENIDASSPAGRFLITILGGVAGLERETIIQRSVEGTNRLARNGAWLGGIVPFGYLAIGKGVDSRLVVSEKLIPGFHLSEAEVVRIIYRMAAEELKSCQAIADHLNALGIPSSHVPDENDPPRGKRLATIAKRWTAGHIRNMLVSTTYKGLHRYGRRTAKEREVFEREVPAIVSPDLWERAQKALHDRQLADPRSSTNTRPYLLRGVIKCGMCGLTYIGAASPPRNGKERVYYVCHGKNQLRGRYGAEGKKCPSKIVKALDLEAAIWKDIETFLRNPTDVIALLAQQLHLQAGEEEQLYTERARQQQESQRLEREKDTVITLFRKGRIDEAALDRQLDQLQLDEANVQKELEDIQEQLQRLQKKVDGLRYAHELLHRLSERLEQPLTWDIKRELVEALVEEIRVDTLLDEKGKKEAKVTVTYRFGPPTVIGVDRDSWHRST
ncbi:MAG TPA: recombinase family protein [Ktedonobacteraceae bacterium]|nr:recombinase family protein [Ktedonobacteraceae bacterium]